MKLKHTPGPWEYEEGIDPQYNIISKMQYICNTLSDNDEANARLIACAPEMLDALISAYLILRDMIPCNQIKHAIERATGLTIEEVLSE